MDNPRLSNDFTSTPFGVPSPSKSETHPIIPSPLQGEGQGGGSSPASKLAFIGAGRLGSSLAQAAAAAGYTVAALSTRRAEHRRWLKTRLPTALVTEKFAEAARLGDIIFITASDAAIADICRSIRWRQGQAAVHCAGALPAAVLDAAAAAGAATGAVHPLQTFPTPDSHGRLRDVSFAVESSDPGLRTWLHGFAQALGGRPFDIKPEHRAAYHASAVMASGLLAGLAGLSAEMWREMGVPRDQALAALSPLISATAEAVCKRGVPAAMTGPYVRGDSETIASHLRATTGRSPDIARVYAALALAQLSIAAEQGGLSEDARSKIERMLRQALDMAA